MCAFCMVYIKYILQHKIVAKLIFQVQTEKMASTEKMVSTFCITSDDNETFQTKQNKTNEATQFSQIN